MTIRKTVLALALAITMAAHNPAQAGAPDDVSGDAAASRFMSVEGGRNFRDVGGYRTADGHVVRSGVLYRAGSMGTLALAGQVKVALLGVTAIVDLRTREERASDRSNWAAMAVPHYWARDYSLSLGEVSRLFADPATLKRDTIVQVMGESYRGLPREMAPGYRQLFARLLEGKGATIVNCTAGKDRTGVGAALVLSALGVPYETVRQDFLASNDAPGLKDLGVEAPAAMRAIAPDVMQALAGVEGAWLDAAFDQMAKDHGSVEGYLDKELGVGAKQIALLRKRMLN